MRKIRDFDSELKALDDKARQLRVRKIQQLGELVVATGADALPAEHLAGLLLSAGDKPSATTREAWRSRGAAFFQRGVRTSSSGDHGQSRRPQTSDGSAQSDAGEDRAER